MKCVSLKKKRKRERKKERGPVREVNGYGPVQKKTEAYAASQLGDIVFSDVMHVWRHQRFLS